MIHLYSKKQVNAPISSGTTLLTSLFTSARISVSFLLLSVCPLLLEYKVVSSSKFPHLILFHSNWAATNTTPSQSPLSTILSSSFILFSVSELSERYDRDSSRDMTDQLATYELDSEL